jgi:hypothetical protein
MCAGRGIMHAEMPVHEEGAPEPRGLQLWVDLPKQVILAMLNGDLISSRCHCIFSLKWW